jgi:hypothetical protein
MLNMLLDTESPARYKHHDNLPSVSIFNNISTYEADVEDFEVLLTSGSLEYINSTYAWNCLLLIDKTSYIHWLQILE